MAQDRRNPVTNYCTYFDSGYLVQGVALWQSLRYHDPDSTLWVLALDHRAGEILHEMDDPSLKVIPLAALESWDVELHAVKETRSLFEYYFTLSPCWPRYLLKTRPDIGLLVYLDADMLLHSSLAPVSREIENDSANVFITSHRFHCELGGHYERHGLYNVGFLAYKKSQSALLVLDDWRRRCLDWCKDEVQEGRYADQKYLDRWPVDFPDVVRVINNPGVNLAPWNWRDSPIALVGGNIVINDQPLVIYHYARFKRLVGSLVWQSGQLDYGVMPFRLRNMIYGQYWTALLGAQGLLQSRGVLLPSRSSKVRLGRAWFRNTLLRLAFGSDWVRVGRRFYSLGWGVGRYSGCVLSYLRRIFLRTNRATEQPSHNQLLQPGK